DQSDVELIQLTVNKVPSPYVLPLMEALLVRYQDFSLDNAHLVHWMRALLIQHTSFIMSQKDILIRLSPFYHSINPRL
ncbi:Utp12 domain-containing protein, partial [Vibrio vulnificus]|uniref:Utp12 domain-containing protein n=1 Tax=Vibrio vulnificus TaxID=672 RepID=UPI0019D4A780